MKNKGLWGREFAATLQRGWYQGGVWWLPLLLPLSWLVAAVAGLRGWLFRRRATRPPVPVLVVGNITVGGTGKTPLVIAIGNHLQSHGIQVAVISRGYGARPPSFPWSVEADQSAVQAGDEPLLIKRRLQCPVIIDPDRRRALDAVIRHHPAVQLVISDDGLQHVRLPRSAEIVLLDAQRGLGNGRCLPAGPLREPATRLRWVRWIVLNGGPDQRWPEAVVMQLDGQQVVNAVTGEQLPLAAFRERHPQVHALAGIGHPERFFASLRQRGLQVVPHAFPDHHHYTPGDLAAFGDGVLLMTEKDMVKCQPFATAHCWYLPVDAHLPPAFLEQLLSLPMEAQRP